MLTLYREWIKSIREKNKFLKNISNCYTKMKKEFTQFLQDKSFGQKSPCGKPHGQKTKFLEKHKQGPYEKGPRKKMVMNGLSL